MVGGGEKQDIDGKSVSFGNCLNYDLCDFYDVYDVFLRKLSESEFTGFEDGQDMQPTTSVGLLR